MKTKTNTLQNNNNIKNTTKSTKKSNKNPQKSTQKQQKLRKKIINWHEYNESLAKRGDFLQFINKAVRAGAFQKIMPSHQKGHPVVYSDQLITLMLVLRELFNLTLRQAVTFTRVALALNGLYYDIPDYTTLCRRAQKLNVEILPNDYGLFINNDICFMLDSSGFKVSGAGEWIRRKWGDTEERAFIETHVGINFNDRIILSVINTDCNVHDNTQLLPSLINANNNLKRARINQGLDTIIGDGAYDANENYHLAKRLGAKFIAPPPKNAKVHMHKDKDKNEFVDDVGWEDRNKVVKETNYRGELDEWKEKVGYHRRSLNENVFFRYKIIFGEKMKHRNKNSCRTEQLIRAKILNTFTMFGLPKYEVI